MDVIDANQARIAEEAGACAVMALERVPADIRRDGGVARMRLEHTYTMLDLLLMGFVLSDPAMIKEIVGIRASPLL